VTSPAFTEVPVTVVGAGPAGLVTSLLLSKYGVRHALIEKYPGMAHTPRAHIINQRTVEILRDLGLESDFRAIAMPWELMTNTVWHTSLSGLELARRQSWGTSPERHADYVAASPSAMANCGQHLLEPMLFDAAARSPLADIRLGHEFIGLAQDDSGVTARVRRRVDGAEFSLRSLYLVGADGGRSRVAEQAGLEYLGEEGISASATIHFHADLSAYTAHRPGALYWNFVPGAGGFRGAGTLICHQPWHDWALAFSYDPDVLDATDEGLAHERLAAIIGDPDVKVELKNISTWTINHVVAREYSAGRVFCMGDAVHRHPPFNGLGLNTSVADAYNLAWKLALVLDGTAGAGLLGSYSEERQPVGQQVVDRAIASIGDLEVLRQALDFDAGQSAESGQEAIRRLFEPGREAQARRDRVWSAVAGTDYQFNAHGVEAGYRYRAGAVAADGSAEPRAERDPDLYYQPTTWPGAHLPHAWLGDGRRQLSTIDLVGGARFTLLTGPGGDAWRDAAARAAAATGAGIDVHAIGTAGGLADCYGDWRRLREVDDSGCVLVRPDRHVAWRALAATPARLAELPAVVAGILREE
jgi:2,4-dichlorophenol 6-monooxygenase